MAWAEISRSKRSRVVDRNLAVATISVLATLVMAAGAKAQDIRRVDASRLSCAAVQNIIAAEGAVILRSRSPFSGRLLWERYVAHRGFCYANEITQYRRVSTADTDGCSVKLCTERQNDRQRFFRD